MPPPIRRRTSKPAETPYAVEIPPPAVSKGPKRRITIPIKVVEAPDPKRSAKAYVRPVDAEEARASSDTRMYAAVVKRYEDKVKNPRTAIRARCIQCCHGQMKEVQLCPSTTCALHPFRMGINPFNKRTAARLAGEAGDDTDEDGDDE